MFSSDGFRAKIKQEGFEVKNFAIDYEGLRRKIVCDISWRSKEPPTDTPALVKELARREGLSAVRWNPMNAGQTNE
jgi:hypothetical protein